MPGERSSNTSPAVPPVPSPQELRRQRALLSEHLAWLDRQIAEAEATQPKDAPIRVPVRTELPSPHPDALSPIAVEQLIEKYQESSRNSPAQARQGCLWAFLLCMALLTLGITAVWWFHYRTPHP